ncbi:MAG: ComEC/Rec2 family competence protein [Rubrimonas sp.]
MRDGLGEAPGTMATRAALWAPDPRRAALWAPVAFGAGVQAYFLMTVEPPLWSLAASVGLAVALFWTAARAGLALRVATVGFALAALGFGAATLRAHMVAAPVLSAEIEAVVEGRIAAVDQSRAGLPRLLLDEVRIYGLAAEATPARVRVALRSARYAEGFRPGDRVSTRARLGPPGGPVEPGAFDFRRAAWFDRLGAVGLASGPPALIARAEGPTLAGLRFDLGAALRARLPGEAGAFAAALAVGDRSGLPPDALEALRTANLAHLLAISGLHMSIVCGLAFFTLRLGLAAAPGVALRAPIKKIAAVGALAAGAGYLALSGASVATERAFVMVAVALVAVLADRPAVSLRALALAALLVLARAPESLGEAGFQMSFAATLALVAVYEGARTHGWFARRRGLARRIGLWAAALVLTSVVAGAATAPFAAYHFNRVSQLGLAANLAATPFLGLVVAPALCAAAVAAPFGLEGAPLRAAGIGIEWMLGVARWIADIPGAARPVAAAPAATLWLVVLGGLVLCLSRPRVFRAAGAATVGAGLALWLAAGPRPDALIAPGGAPVGVATATGRALAGAERSVFAAETWLRRDGDAATWREGAARPGFAAEGAWRRAVLRDGTTLHLNLGRRPDARGAVARCAGGGVVITPDFDWRVPDEDGAPACVALTRARLAETGALALRVDRSGLRLARADAADRLWSGAAR